MDDRWDPDPYHEHRPWLRRPFVRGSVAVLAAGSLAIITLMSTCAPRRRTVPATTTTTTIGITALETIGGR